MSFIRSKLLILFFGILSVYITFNIGKWREYDMLSWDIAGYYLYLPATFIYKDLGHLSYYPKVDSTYKLSEPQRWFGIYDVPATGKKIDKFPAGVAIFELPFFLLTHAYVLLSKTYPADGYSVPYMISNSMATIFWVVCGLFVLRKFLLRYYSERVVFYTIVLLAFGTNLYNYTAFEGGMSHPYSFFLFAAFIYCTDLFYSTERSKYLLLMGLLLGWIVITRPTNIVIGLWAVLWATDNCNSWKDKLGLLKKNAGALALSILLFLAVLSIQAAYWKYITGHWIYYSYEKEGFDFVSPHIWDGLFSYRKGWFLYTPIALFIMGGFICLYNTRRRMVLPVLAYLIVTVCLVFSWHAWAYGGSFSARALVEGLAILSVPLAAFVAWLLELRAKLLKAGIVAVLVLMICLNMFQTYQYSHGVIKSDYMTKELYWGRFFDLDSED